MKRLLKDFALSYCNIFSITEYEREKIFDNIGIWVRIHFPIIFPGSAIYVQFSTSISFDLTTSLVDKIAYEQSLLRMRAA